MHSGIIRKPYTQLHNDLPWKPQSWGKPATDDLSFINSYEICFRIYSKLRSATNLIKQPWNLPERITRSPSNPNTFLSFWHQPYAQLKWPVQPAIWLHVWPAVQPAELLTRGWKEEREITLSLSQSLEDRPALFSLQTLTLSANYKPLRTWKNPSFQSLIIRWSFSMCLMTLPRLHFITLQWLKP